VETLETTQTERLQYARVLVELGDLSPADLVVAGVLDENPENLDALSLFAKLKHMRRQLSLAVACTAQLQSREAASGEQARMHLETMLHLARDPAHGAGEFLALGQFQLVQKPTAYLALEEAFRLYVDRRPADARSMCRQVAGRYRDRDMEVYKLAVLAEAWICELIGDLGAAGEILERLGLERGFEVDMDRLMALVSVYEKNGTPDALEAAVNICKYFEQNAGGSAVFGRLALLHRRLGQVEVAERYEERHLAAYRKERHRPGLIDVVSVAARRFLPLERLRRIHLPDLNLDEDRSGRERAIAAALAGDLEAARRAFAAGDDLLDLKYLADLEGLESGNSGKDDRAIELYVKALRADPTDGNVIAWLLDREQRAPSKQIESVFQEKAILADVLRHLENAVHDAPNDVRAWRRLATLFRFLPGKETQQAQFAERAQLLEKSALERSRASGRVLSAATYRFAGRVHGLIHEIWATREATEPGQGGSLRREDILGNLTPEMRDDVRNTFLAVREYAVSKFPHLTGSVMDFHYGYKVTKEDEPSGGTSAGLPTALAFLSVFLQRPVLPEIASSGCLVTDAHDVLTVRTVGEADPKVDAAYERNLSAILLPQGNRPLLEQSAVVPRAITAEIVRYVSDLDEALPLAFGPFDD
jgi:tetratricopeptide (TPR) repeat protein